MVQKNERYTLDDEGLLVEKVGPWARRKLELATDYVHASGGARSHWPEAAYIDVFCEPGRSLIRDTTQFIDGSPIAAFKKANGSAKPFTSINISDAYPDLLRTAERRLRALRAPVHATPGPASRALPRIVKNLPQSGLHLAFLDPHSLGTLSFDLFEQLANLRNVDIIVHVSLSDLQRNADRYTSEAHDQFDKFAPGWRDRVGADMNQEALRRAIIKYWSNKIMELGLPRAEHCQLIKGPHGQRLYWLMLLARHPLAHDLWTRISSLANSPEFDF